MGAGCLPSLAPAPFPAASDTTEPGTLLGPFSGRVSEGQGRPVPGALVWVAWRFCKGVRICLPAGTETASVETDADGRYELPRLRRFPGAVRLEGMTLIVYKRGYVGYRSDRIFDEKAAGGAVPRRDFAQTRNDARLEPFPEGASHATHLLFLGGSGTLRTALRAEALQAAIDAAGQTAQANAAAVGQIPLDATTLLSVEELRQVTGALDDITVERLDDRPRSPRYDSAHFRAAGKGEDADAAFRVYFDDTPSESEQTYETLLKDLPNAQPLDPVPAGLGSRAARGQDGGADGPILGLLVLDRAQRATVLFTCGTTRCRNPELVEALTRKVIARLPRMAHPPPNTAPKPVEDEGLKLREPGLTR